MKNNRFTLAIIGLGKIGLGFDLNSQENQVFSHTKAALKHAKVDLIGGVDNSAECRAQFESYSNKPAFVDITSLLNVQVPDLFIISVPTRSHREIFETVAPLAPRGILLEKPLAHTLEDARIIAGLARKFSVPVYVNYVRRSDPQIKYLRQEIRNERLGKPLGAHVWYAKGILNNGSHFVNLIQFLLGTPRSVSRLGAPRASIAPDDRDVDFSLNFDGFSATFQCAVEEKYSVGEMDILFEGGRYRLTEFGAVSEYFTVTPDPDFPDLSILAPARVPVSLNRSQYQSMALNDFIDLVQSQPFSPENMNDALETLELCLLA